MTLLVALAAADARAQQAAECDDTGAAEPAAAGWSGSASIYGYLTPDDSDYLQPTLAADRGALHLEARYNYENLGTASAWVGYAVHAGETLVLDLTPMMGVVLGDTAGVAAGLHLSLAWSWLQLYSEGELVLDTREPDDSFFYSWTELTLAPADWLRAGLVAQRTRVYESAREIQRGLLLGITLGRFGLTAHVFDPDTDAATFVLALGVEL